MLLGLYGHSNSGKTTLLEELIPRLEELGLRVATIKQTHHDVTAATEGKDTWRHRRAGANPVALSSRAETALFLGQKLPLEKTVALIRTVREVDLILLEGWKDEEVPKIFLGDGQPRPGTVLRFDGQIKPVVDLIQRMLAQR